MSADVLDEVIRKAGKGLQHRSQPAAVNLIIGTERGTAYPVIDIARIAEVAKRHGGSTSTLTAPEWPTRSLRLAPLLGA